MTKIPSRRCNLEYRFDMTSLGFKLPAKYAERRPDTDKSCGMGLQLLPTVEGPKLDLRLVKLLAV